MQIPAQLDILARASDLRRDMQLQRDASGVKALNAIIASVVCDYDVLAWGGPYLTVASESEVGKTHQVSAFGCSCDARRPCWHMRLRDILISIFETECEDADQAAIADDLPALRPMGARIADARADCWARL